MSLPGPKRYGTFLIPEFGFVASREVRDTGERRPQRLHASRIYFWDYAPAPEGEMPVLEPVGRAFRRCGAGRAALLALRQAGVGQQRLPQRRLQICAFCGWAEPAQPLAPAASQSEASAHTNPRTGQPCSGPLETYHLGHEFITDVLEIALRRRAGAAR